MLLPRPSFSIPRLGQKLMTIAVGEQPGASPAQYLESSNSNTQVRSTIKGQFTWLTVKMAAFRSSTLNRNFSGEIDHLGRTYSLKLMNGALWASMGPFEPRT
jgi:hypothetical protein